MKTSFKRDKSGDFLHMKIFKFPPCNTTSLPFKKSQRSKKPQTEQKKLLSLKNFSIDSSSSKFTNSVTNIIKNSYIKTYSDHTEKHSRIAIRPASASFFPLRTEKRLEKTSDSSIKIKNSLLDHCSNNVKSNSKIFERTKILIDQNFGEVFGSFVHFTDSHSKLRKKIAEVKEKIRPKIKVQAFIPKATMNNALL